MDPWVGPAIIAAIVSGVVSAVGWFVNSWQSRRNERASRAEKVHDFQVALLAEIESDLLSTSVFDRAELLRSVSARYREEPGYSVLVPHLASNVIFDAIVKEIHILPGDVIGPVVDYQRLRQTLERFAADLRASNFGQLPPERQLVMYTDYLEIIGRLEELAQRAAIALQNSLEFNTPDVGRLSPPSAWAAAARDEEQASADSERTRGP
jgi:hypothetical protein